MNLQQLKDIVAIAREGSITRASRVLFKAQPNLSSMLHEVEAELNITIFDRTPSGVRLTPQGERFIACAGSIISQLENLESIGKKPEEKLSLGISVCRASYCVRAVSDWMAQTLDENQQISVRLHETNTDEAIEQVFRAESALGIIRLPSFHADFYEQQLKHRSLCHAPLMDFCMMLIMQAGHPLSEFPDITLEDLYQYTEIVHGDQQIPDMSRISPLIHSVPPRRIYVYDRGSQIDLLDRLPGAYMWVSPIPLDMVDSYGMILKSSSLSTAVNRDLLIWRRGALSDPRLKSLSQFLHRYAARLKEDTLKRLNPA